MELRNVDQLNDVLITQLQGYTPMNAVEKIELRNLAENLQRSEELFSATEQIVHSMRMFAVANAEFFQAMRGSHTQASVAKRANVPQPYASALERGHIEIVSDAALLKLLRAYVELSEEDDPIMLRRQVLQELMKGD